MHNIFPPRPMSRDRCLRFLLCGALALAGTWPAWAQDAHTPAVGTAERRDILAAARTPVEEELGQPVRFRIDRLRVVDGWAFLLAVPEDPQGQPLDYSRTPYAEAQREGMFDDGIVALLQSRNGSWTPVVHVIGATDVPWVTWADDHGAPQVLFTPE